VTRGAAEKALGRNLDEMLAQANTRGFRAAALNLSVSGAIPTKMRAARAANVAGMVRGSDPELRQQAVGVQRALGPSGGGRGEGERCDL
jgi:hypothetical protein